MTVQAIMSKNEFAAELARLHFEIEPGMQKVMWLESPDDVNESEPLKLLEVNSDTVPAGLLPVHFGAGVKNHKWHPPVIIYEITPAEFADLQNGKLILPKDHSIRQAFERADFQE